MSLGSVRYPVTAWVSFVLGTPVNYYDPTGRIPFPPRIPCSVGDDGGWSDDNVETRVNEAEKYVYHTSDPMDTYVAAGIAIQCAGWDINRDEYGSVGIAQISIQAVETEWQLEIWDEDGNLRAYGLRKRCLNGQLEKALDPYDPKDAVVLMKRRIEMVTVECINCTATDIYIAAALAQNGSGFTHINMQQMSKITPQGREENGYPDVKMDWFKYFKNDKQKHPDMENTKTQLIRFDVVISELRMRRWIVPFIDSNVVEKLKNW